MPGPVGVWAGRSEAMRRSAATVMRPVRSCCAVSALLLLLLAARSGSALPAESRLDEREAIEAEEALNKVVDSIRERLMRELGITNTKPFRVSTSDWADSPLTADNPASEARNAPLTLVRGAVD